MTPSPNKPPSPSNAPKPPGYKAPKVWGEKE